MKTGFGQFCPVAVACEIFAERWTPMVLRELFCGSRHFNEIHRGVPLMSRALLARRLRELESAGVIVKEALVGKRGHAYALTPAGREFQPALEALGNWGQRWTIRVRRDRLDAGFLMWNVRRRIACDLLPDGRTVVCFRFTGVPRGHRSTHQFWLVLERADVELCIEDPGIEVDLQVDADLATMVGVWLGDRSFDDALRSKGVQVLGPRRLAAAFPQWLMLSHYAGVPRPVVDGALKSSGGLGRRVSSSGHASSSAAGSISHE
jgi:DNA-binding HxlR family transcriptional regulator